jgi:hypothetical protein
MVTESRRAAGTRIVAELTCFLCLSSTAREDPKLIYVSNNPHGWQGSQNGLEYSPLPWMTLERLLTAYYHIFRKHSA